MGGSNWSSTSKALFCGIMVGFAIWIAYGCCPGLSEAYDSLVSIHSVISTEKEFDTGIRPQITGKIELSRLSVACENSSLDSITMNINNGTFV